MRIISLKVAKGYYKHGDPLIIESKVGRRSKTRERVDATVYLVDHNQLRVKADGKTRIKVELLGTGESRI